ncbi:hypothetical protein HYC85_013883 [Camellia sinensis]|uniref:Glutathione peroxidase n=1 Tax=Camellia sinensis TaxID=4442 RepID=A0A7J7H804_CAMSI|nr:hypothetical protein HYC85_013883 [Camellia sinensis]
MGKLVGTHHRPILCRYLKNITYPTRRIRKKDKTHDSKGKDVDLSIYKGKFIDLYTHVPIFCWLVSAFEILAFPCNQFLHQEPGTSAEAELFACTRYKAEYPIFHKLCVNGPRTAPIYKFLKASKGAGRSGFLGPRIKWNFTKFLVDKEGEVIRRYGTTTPVFAIEPDIQKALGEITGTGCDLYT